MRGASRLTALAAALLASPAFAASGEIPLGDIPRYGDEAGARAGCGHDPVVWADRHSGFYYPKFHQDYGRTANGAYTCYGVAKRAGYWSLVPEGENGREGREFPEFFCYTCS